MRSIICGAVTACAFISSTYAANLPVKAPPATQPLQTSTWTGFYLGGQVGYGWDSTTDTIVTPTEAFVTGTVLPAHTPSGALGGFYGGYNYQFDPHFLAGIDADYSWADLQGGDIVAFSNTGVAGGRTHFSAVGVNSLATVTGRLGYLVNNDLLFFGKGGWAWSSMSGHGSTINSTTGALTGTNSSSDTPDGYTVGAGAEWALAAHWSTKLEYDYVKFNTSTVVQTDISAAGAVSHPIHTSQSYMNVLKVGAAYRF